MVFLGVLIVLSCTVPLHAEGGGDPYEMLRHAVSVFWMLPNSPETYRCNLELEGTMYNDMKNEIERNYGVSPHFVEYFDRKRGRIITLDSPSIPRERKQQYTSAFFPFETPFQMSQEQLGQEIESLRKETVAEPVAEDFLFGQDCYRITLLPAQEGFNYYSHLDSSPPYKRWTEKSVFYISKSQNTVVRNINHIVNELLDDEGKTAEVQKEKMLIDTTFKKVYDTVLPSKMIFSSNGVDFFEQSFFYRKDEGHVLLDRIMLNIFSQEMLGMKNTIEVTCADYELNIELPEGIAAISPAKQ
jgi:hypothetical protein